MISAAEIQGRQQNNLVENIVYTDSFFTLLGAYTQSICTRVIMGERSNVLFWNFASLKALVISTPLIGVLKLLLLRTATEKWVMENIIARVGCYMHTCVCG